jgi:hypothetical protein
LRIHADVMLAEQCLQLAVAVTMKVACTAVLAVPAPERVVTKHQHVTVNRKLGEWTSVRS